MNILYIVLITLMVNILAIVYQYNIKEIIQPNEIIDHNDNPIKKPIHNTINKTVNKKTVINKLSCDTKCKKMVKKLAYEMIIKHVDDEH